MTNSWRIFENVYNFFDRSNARCSCTTYDCFLFNFHCSIMNIIEKTVSIVDKSQSEKWNDLNALKIDNDDMNDDEYKVHFFMWVMIKSALIMKINIFKMIVSIYSIFVNLAVIVISQDIADISIYRVWNRETNVDDYDQNSHFLWIMFLFDDDFVIALLNVDNTSMILNAILKEIFIDKTITTEKKTKRFFSSSSDWNVYDLWTNRMNDVMTNFIIQNNATINEIITNFLNYTTFYNATEMTYADDVKNNHTAFLEVKINLMSSMKIISAMISRHDIAMFRFKKQNDISLKKRSEL